MGEESLRIPEGLAPEALKSLKEEHMNAYRMGSGFSKMTYRWDSLPTDFSSRGRVFLWITGLDRLSKLNCLGAVP